MAAPKKDSQGNDQPEIGDALGMIETRGLIGMHRSGRRDAEDRERGARELAES